jgi:hypothetical protein
MFQMGELAGKKMEINWKILYFDKKNKGSKSYLYLSVDDLGDVIIGTISIFLSFSFSSSISSLVGL